MSNAGFNPDWSRYERDTMFNGGLRRRVKIGPVTREDSFLCGCSIVELDETELLD